MRTDQFAKLDSCPVSKKPIEQNQIKTAIFDQSKPLIETRGDARLITRVSQEEIYEVASVQVVLDK